MTPTLPQVLATASPGDAVTGQALAWRSVLQADGVRSDIYAEHIHPDLAGMVRPYRDLPQSRGPILLRYSIWSAAAAAARKHRGPLGFVYHNVTPGHMIGPANPTVAQLCDRGRRELPSFASRAACAIADSAYNAAELRQAGFPRPTVIPLMLALPDPPPPRVTGSQVILYVGRVAPSKRVDDLLRVLAYVRARALPQATLEIIGSHADFPDYRRSLDALARSLNVRDAVVFRGRVGDADRDAAYATAGAYLSMSAHEGFCAPLLEAMSHGVPVVARAAAAVPGTVGHAALLVPGRNVPLAGEAVICALTDMRVRRGLATNARRRLGEVDARVIRPQILDAVAPLLAA